MTDTGTQAGGGFVNHVLPLRPGMRATLVLPDDLTTDEARQVAAFVSAVAAPDTTEVTP